MNVSEQLLASLYVCHRENDTPKKIHGKFTFIFPD